MIYKVGDTITWHYLFPEICKITEIVSNTLICIILWSPHKSRVGHIIGVNPKDEITFTSQK